MAETGRLPVSDSALRSRRCDRFRGFCPLAAGLASGVNLASGSKKSPWKSALAVMSVGIEMGVAVSVGYFAGSWLDNRFGTTPWLMYLLLVLGIAAAFRGLWRTARKYWNSDGE